MSIIVRNKMKKKAKIFIAGATGMVGSAIVRKLLTFGYTNLIGSYNSSPPEPKLFSNSNDNNMPEELQLIQLDLRQQDPVGLFFHDQKPDYVFLAAAKVGGIYANNNYPAEFIHDNLVIQNNIIHSAYQTNVDRLLFLGSSCIYPKLSPQPIEEEYLLTGILEPTNEPYAISKIAGMKMCESYNRQYNTQFIAAMPTNLYGYNDNFDLQNSHVLPALIRKFHEAKISGKNRVIVWGSGKPKREFLHVDDMADACIFIMNLKDKIVSEQILSYPKPCFLNIGTGVDCTIQKLANIVQDVVGFKGELFFDTTKPDGTPQKLLDVSKMEKLGWHSSTSLVDGIHQTYQWFKQNICL